MGIANESDIEPFLRAAAARHDSDAAIELFEQLTDPTLRARAGEVLGDLLVRGGPRDAEFAGHLAQMFNVVPKTPRVAALRRPDLPAQGHLPFGIAAALRDEILAARAPYDESLREFADRPDLDGVLAPVFLVHDHSWFLENWKRVLSDDAYQADYRLRSSVKTWAEAHRVLEELQARRAEVGDAVIRAFDESVAQFFAQPKDD